MCFYPERKHCFPVTTFQSFRFYRKSVPFTEKGPGSVTNESLSHRVYRQRFSRFEQQEKKRWRQVQRSWRHLERLHLKHFEQNSRGMGRSFCHYVVYVNIFLFFRLNILHIFRLNVPEGLISLLEKFTQKPGEGPEERHARLCRSLWGKLWVGFLFVLCVIYVMIRTVERHDI